MFKLTATQMTLLLAACAREDGLAVRPDTLRLSGAAKLVAKLLKEGLVRELRAKGDMPVWREDDDGKSFSLKILKAGRTAVQAIAPQETENNGPAAGGNEEAGRASAATVEQPTQVTNTIVAKPGSKRALLLALLSREGGATIAVMIEATGWLPHTTRSALSGLRKSGLAIERARNDRGGAPVYRIGPTSEAVAA